MRRDLDDKGLDQNKVLYSSSGAELPMVNYYIDSPTLPTPGRQISGYPPASGFKTTLTRISLSRLFFVASFGALLSAPCWLSSFSLCGELDYWLGHGQSGVQGYWCG